MSSIIKVDTIQDQDGNNIINENANTITIGKSGDTVTVASGATFVGGGIEWQSAIKTASFTAVAGEGYWVNTTSSAITITLPASASVGDQIIFTDYARTWGTNAVTVNQNSLNYQGQTSPNPEYNTSGQSVNIVYSGATQGWIPNSDDDVTDEVPQPYSVDFLVVAGGGGGYRSGACGGGGAGGYRNSYSTESSGGGGSSETSLSFTGGTVYTITVGAGGAGAVAPGVGVAGSDSSISGSGITTITSVGGGTVGTSSGDCGSGAGGADFGGAGGSGTANQGFDGGSGGPGGGDTGGGGGAGEDGNTDGQGHGGDGLSSSITGSAVTRGGGGAGAGGTSRPGGDGGGGNASSPSGNGGDGTANTGGGGGGGAVSSPNDGGDGGSGVVILRMATADYSGTTTGSPTVTTDGSDTILIFNSSGSYTG